MTHRDIASETTDPERLGTYAGTKPASARLYAILARDARTGVIFRRGPTRQVQLIRWDLRTDTFEHGQWFKGRIYERRCEVKADFLNRMDPPLDAAEQAGSQVISHDQVTDA